MINVQNDARTVCLTSIGFIVEPDFVDVDAGYIFQTRTWSSNSWETVSLIQFKRCNFTIIQTEYILATTHVEIDQLNAQQLSQDVTGQLIQSH